MNKLTRPASIVLFVISLSLQGGCKSPGGSSLQEKRTSVQEMRTNTLSELHRRNPEIEGRVNNAPGYAVFSNYGLKFLIAGGGNGYGVAHDNKSGRDTYMRMGEVNVGLGFGAKDVRVLFVFNTERAMRDFVEKGWDFGGDAEAGAKLKNEGAEVTKAVSVGDIDIYQFAKNGATLQATVGGTKYWKDKDLNAAP